MFIFSIMVTMVIMITMDTMETVLSWGPLQLHNTTIEEVKVGTYVCAEWSLISYNQN